MLNSYTRSPSKQNGMKESKNHSTLHPGITSTPLITPNRLVTPPRKLLGNRRYSLSSNGFISPVRASRTPTGPLLASTSYNVNVSTYIDTKSPGFARRLVQYNEENCRRPQYTHQEKYDSPGQFPIVHLFKKDIPVITPKSRKPTIRIGTPEHKSPYSQDHSRLLLEGIVRNNSTLKGRDHGSDGTRSVLDALKEISRKRIHASEEYEIIDDTNKKLKRDCVINEGGETSKRNRMDSPTSDNSTSPPISQAKKRVCTIDAVLASRTSSMYEIPKSNKKKLVRDSETTTPESKKFNTVETQTLELSTENKKLTDEYLKENKETETISISSEDKDKEIPEPQPTPPPLKVFDDKPLEIMRKNRLAALLSALTGKEIPRIPTLDRRKALEESWASDSANKGFDTILTQEKDAEKTTKPAEKHVTFCLPENTKTTTKVSESARNPEKIIEVPKLPEIIKTPVVNDAKLDEKVEKTAENDKIAPVLGGFQFETPKSTPAPPGGFKFDLNKPIVNDKPLTAATSTASVVLTPKTSESKVGSTKSEDNSSNFLTNFTKSSPLKSTNSLGLPSSLPQTSLITSPSTVSTSTEKSSPTFSFGKTEAPKSIPTFGITSNTSTTTKTETLKSIPSFPQPSTVSTSTEKSPPTFSFGKKEAPKSIPTFGLLSNAPTISKAEALKSIPNFGMNSNASTINKTEALKPIPGFGITSNPSTAPNATVFSNSSPSNFTKSKLTVSSSSNTSNLTVSTSNPIMMSAAPFNPPISSKSISNSVTTTSNSFFSTPSSFTTTNFGTATTSTASPSFNFSTSTPAFGQVSTQNSFGATSAPTNSFGANPTTAGNASSFGANPTTPGNASSFGANPTTTATSFVSPFNSSSTNPMFGATTTTTTSSFGANPISSSNSTKPFAFGTNNQSFNSSNKTMLTKNSQSSMTLGTNTTASSASNIPFGTTSPTFGTTNLFPSKSSVPSFATTTTPTFGVTTASSGFSNNLNFASNNSFGKSGFGAPTTTTSALFGVNSTSTFGGTPITSSFGGNNFGTPSTVSSGFGTNGANNVPFGTTTASSMFGTTNVQSFGGGTTSSGFGTTNTPSFGTSNSFNNFNAASAPFGNPTTTSSGSFSGNIAPFGTNAGTSFNGFGTQNSPFNPITTASSFGANNSFGTTFGNPSSTNSFNFGANGTTAPNAFGGTSNNMTSNGFDSGFGTSAPKSEPSTLFPSQTSSNIFNSSFGSSSSNAPTNGVFTFGAPNAQSSSSGGVFAFGGGEAPKTFNFNAPGAAPNNARGGFPAAPAPTFGAANNVPNMFSIGSGSTTSSSQNRNSRPLARAKRRY